jgi:class 3 adenylate cyclase
MQCISCGHANPEDARFCGQCASPLARTLTCPRCRQENPFGQKFCNGCAAALAQPAPAAASGSAGAFAPAPSAAGPAHSAPAAPESAAPMPASVAGGRYLLSRFLGEGARKRVYLARDTRLDSMVALALVKTDGLDADGLTRVGREAQAMGRLRDHPHIVSVFDIGDENGQPYIVSQLMEGGSVEARLRDAPNFRLPLAEAVAIAEQICQALDHAHSHEIVHRDLKPGNVWLSHDGSAQLGDFGLAVALDRSRLTQEGVLVGTVAYIAPEQAVGTEPDARSDLYALGAMLYEMVTGRPPFLGDDALAVVSQHLNTAPVAPAWHSPDVPEALDALILKLLEKDPERRPPSAVATAEALQRIAKELSAPAQAAPARAAPAGPRTPWGRFVGRHDELEQLKSALEGALSGRGSLAMIVGEPGIGKSRLSEEFAVYAKLRGAQVLTGRSYEGSLEVPYYPFVECFRQYVSKRADSELRRELGSGAPDVATLVSEIRQRFPDLPAAPPLQGDAERLRLFESAASFLHNAAASHPLVLILDDLHWADKPSLLMLRYLTRNLAGARLLLVGTYRDVELDRTHPLAEVLAALRREPIYRRILLRGLPESEVDGWLAALAADDGTGEPAERRRQLSAALYRETEGNPFFIGEVLTHLAEEGKLVHEEGRWRARVTSISELGIPEGVREVVGRRLSRVSEACSRMLALAAAMPAGFTWEALRATSDEDEAELLDALEEALAAHLIQERKDGRPAAYEFTHALIRQTLYEELSAPRRVLVHRRIGERLEALYADHAGPHMAELAHHFFQAAPGGDVDKAIDYAVHAGERAASTAAYEEAIEHFERALQALDLRESDDAARRCEILLTLAEFHGRTGTFDQGREFALRAAELARSRRSSEDLALAALRLGGELPMAPALDEERIALLHEALEAFGGRDDPLCVRLLSRLSLELAMPDPPRAVPFCDEALAMARRLGELESLAYALHARHDAFPGPEYLEERLELASEMLEVARAADLTDFISVATSNRLVDLLEQGDAAEAKAAIASYVTLNEKLRDPHGLWLASVYRAHQALLEGRFAEAERLANDALAHARRFEHGGGVAFHAIQIARVRFEQGRLEEQLAMYEAADNSSPHQGWRGRMALLYAELGRTDEARREFEALAVGDFAEVRRDMLWLLVIAYASEVCAVLGDIRRAEILYPLLLPHAGRNIMVMAAACNGSASRPLAMLASTLGRFDEAERHFEETLADSRRMQSPPLLARAECDFARMLLTRDGPGDRDRALQLAAQALAKARELDMKILLERALAVKLDAQGVAAVDTEQSIFAVASHVHREPPDLLKHAAPDGTVTLLFSDMEGFTPMTERLGDLRAREVIRDHNRIVREQTAKHGGYEVELQGDGFLLAFGSARAALQCAVDVQRALASRNSGEPEEPIRVRIGVHTGEAIKDADKFFGRTVILAARIAAHAKGGEVLVSGLVRELTQSLGDLRYGDLREVQLKGIREPQRLCPLIWS